MTLRSPLMRQQSPKFHPIRDLNCTRLGTEIEPIEFPMKALSMHVAYVAVLLLLPIAGCASRGAEPSVSQPESVAEEPAKPQTGAAPKQPATLQPAPAAAPAPKATTPAPKPAGKTAPPAARAPAPVPIPNPRAPRPAAAPAVAPLDLIALKDQLKATKAIGVFTKIALKNQVDDLMDQFRAYYQGNTKTTMPELRRRYDLLMMKVLSLLQDSDQKLASEVVSSREAIWALLSDPKKFATLPT